MARWLDAEWRQVVDMAVHWYVGANGLAGLAEGSIVLARTALELLASAVLMDAERLLGGDAYKNLPAADKLRLLFGWPGIPIAIPAGLPT